MTLAPRAHSAGAAVVALAMLGCGAGGATGEPGSTTRSALRSEPQVTYVFTRELVRARHGERNVSELTGELRVAAPGRHQLVITRARQLQSDYVLREIDPSAGGARVSIEQRVGAEGARAEPLDTDAVFALGTELAQALTLVPVGGTGLVLPIANDGAATLHVGWPRESGLPPEVQVRCTRTDVPGTPGWQRVSCGGPLDRALEVSEVASADGVSADLRGTIALEATLDPATGLGHRVELRIVMDVVERMGAYEEHEAAELVLTSELSTDPASRTRASQLARDPCAPQRAGATGDCDAELDFFVWDGADCVHAGSGCGCAGDDCEHVYRSPAACREARTACLAR